MKNPFRKYKAHSTEKLEIKEGDTLVVYYPEDKMRINEVALMKKQFHKWVKQHLPPRVHVLMVPIGYRLEVLSVRRPNAFVQIKEETIPRHGIHIPTRPPINPTPPSERKDEDNRCR